LGEDVGGIGIGLEEADAVFLVEEKIEIAVGCGLNVVELAVAGDGTEAGEDELLGLLSGEDSRDEETKDAQNEPRGGSYFRHGHLAAVMRCWQPALLISMVLREISLFL
jgi:hypothetical protein